MGPKKDSSLRIGALSTMAPQDTETAKTKIPLETSSLLIFSAGKRRDKIFKAIPVHASLKPKKTLKYAVTTAKILRIRLKILTAPRATMARAEILFVYASTACSWPIAKLKDIAYENTVIKRTKKAIFIALIALYRAT